MLLSAVTLMTLTAVPPAGRYTLDPKRTVLLVQLRPDDSRILSGLSHRHVVRATKPSGEMQFDPARPESCRILVLAKVVDLEVDAADMRRRVGYDDVLDADDIEDIKENMLDDDQLDGAKHPDIGFLGDRCTPQPDGQILVQGKLTVRGREAALSLPMTVDYRNRTLTARGEFTLKHAAFGFEPYSAALGALANDDWLYFTVEVVARRPRSSTESQTKTSTSAP